MRNKILITLLSSVLIASNAGAAPNNSSAPNAVSQNSTSSANKDTVTPLTVNNSVLQQADDDYAKLQALKRQAAIKEQQDKIAPKIVANGSVSNGNKSGGISETVVTNVVIDSNGINFATLQFADGSSLNVEPGTKIGKYVVSSIDLTGVRLSSCTHKKCGKGILIKRAYPVAPKSTTTSSSQSTAIFTPNNSGSNDAVPPLAKVN